MGSMLRRRLSKYKQARLVEYFVTEITSRTAASLCRMDRKWTPSRCLELAALIPIIFSLTKSWRNPATFPATFKLSPFQTFLRNIALLQYVRAHTTITGT